MLQWISREYLTWNSGLPLHTYNVLLRGLHRLAACPTGNRLGLNKV